MGTSVHSRRHREFGAAHLRQPEIEHDHIGPHRRHHLQSVLARGRFMHRVAVRRKQCMQESPDRRLVVNYQNTRS